MCGIVAYVGKREAFPILAKGLKRLEYRGYDSAGVALLNGGIELFKKKGKVDALIEASSEFSKKGQTGIGHTRWATHGEPNDVNAHPHLSGNGRLCLVHNGIIENYNLLKKALEKDGHRFVSDTDTEVLVHLIEEIQEQDGLPLEEAVRIALTRVVGAYAIVVMDREDPGKLIAARKASPLVIGIGEGEYFLASDATPIIEYTNQVIYLNDGEIAIVTNGGKLQVRTISNEVQNPFIHELDMEIESLEKGGYDYFMLKEIHEQPTTVMDGMRGRLNPEEGWIHLGGVEEYSERLSQAKRLIIVACGTSWHAGLIGEYLFEELARVPVEVEYASEFRYRNPILSEEDVVIAISQSGETADTLAAIEIARQSGALIYGIVNVVGSSIARLTDAGSYIHAGPEIGVASTKAFTGQLTLLTLMALHLAHKRGTISISYYHRLINELAIVPKKMKRVLHSDDKIREIAAEIVEKPNALYLGRGYNFPVALEGALKLKEISYIHAEGYPAAEMKHGPIALIDEEMPVIVIATNKSAYEKIVSNIQEVKARKGI
ncbi:MAG: glutamine--fructose-6-phosphate transaminase (isomerizing), partial [Saprospiraceae bacterium]|nr:glutamine--fructose-6-phosphate transaminase (isomerizing) [Saprospiraceae bacterium]